MWVAFIFSGWLQQWAQKTVGSASGKESVSFQKTEQFFFLLICVSVDYWMSIIMWWCDFIILTLLPVYMEQIIFNIIDPRNRTNLNIFTFIQWLQFLHTSIFTYGLLYMGIYIHSSQKQILWWKEDIQWLLMTTKCN